MLINIGILGLGTVGGGVVNVLTKNQIEILRRSGANIKVTHALVKNLNQDRICPTKSIKLTQDPFAIVNDKSIDIVLELIGGTDLAKTLVEQAIKNKKPVITANKALIAIHGNELLALAKNHNTPLLFEAAVAGGIPILKSLEQGLSANQIQWVAGIINGTGNFILTQMCKQGESFDNALSEAQSLGYAEADPSFDIQGTDTAHKLTILTSIAFGCELQFNQVNTIGINQINSEDIAFADELGYVIKHLGIAKKTKDGLQMRVHPTLILKTHLLANVNGVMNAVLVKGNAVGSTIYYGVGAGDNATASAVIADLIDIIKDTTSHDVLGWKKFEKTENYHPDDIESIFYLHLVVKDKSGILDDINDILAKHNITIMQKIIKTKNNTHITIITNLIKTKVLNKAVAEIQIHDSIQEDVKIIHVDTLN